MGNIRDARDLGELGDALRAALTRDGRRVRPEREASRGFAAAPTMGEWAAAQGVGLERLSTSDRERLSAAFRRCMERALGDAFWDSNHTAQYNLPVREPPSVLGVEAAPIPTRDVERVLRDAPPTTFEELAAVLKGASERGGEDRYRPKSHKSKTGRRAALQAPTFEQWAIKCGLRLSHLSRLAVTEAEAVYADLLEQYLHKWFGGRGKRARGAQGLRLAPRTGFGGTGRARVSTRRGSRAATGELLATWLRGRFVDYDDALTQRFLDIFPRPDSSRIIELAETTWQTEPDVSGAREPKFRNFTRFLNRAAAVVQAMRAKPGLTMAAANDWVFNEFNRAYEIVQRLARDKGAGTLDPIVFAATLARMPAIVGTEVERLQGIANEIRSRYVGVDLSQTELFEQVVRRVQLGAKVGATDGALNEVVRTAKKQAEGRRAGEKLRGKRHKVDGVYTQPGGVAGAAPGDALYAMRDNRFGLRSTRDLVDRKIRKGTEPWNPRGTAWVRDEPYGEGRLTRDVNPKDELVRAVVDEIVALGGRGQETRRR